MSHRFRLDRAAVLGALLLAILPAMLHPAYAAPSPAVASWVAALNGPANGDDHARAVAVDARGDVVAAGDLVTSGFGSDFVVAKLRGSSGGELWRTTVPGTDRGASSSADAVALDGAGHVFAAGTIVNRNTFGDFAVAKLDGPSGRVLWRTVLDGGVSSGDRGIDVVVDSQGDAIAAGYLQTGGPTGIPKFAVLKFDGATGAVQWRVQLDGGGGIRQQVNALTVDSQDNIVAAGVIAGSTENFAVVKLAGSTGAVQWRVELNGTKNQLDEAYAVSVDSSGDVVAAGNIQQARTGYDFALVKLDGASGARQWLTLVNGRQNFADLALDIAVDENGDVAAAGILYNRNQNFADFAVIKFNGDSGAQLWRRQIGGSGHNVAWALAVNQQGNVVAAGERTRAGSQSDLAIFELAATTGAIVDSLHLNGTGNWFDQALDVAIDPAGNSVAVGNLVNRGTGSDFAVVQFPGGSP